MLRRGSVRVAASDPQDVQRIRMTSRSAMTQSSNLDSIPTNAFKRLIFMILFFALFGAVRLLMWVVVLIQFLSHLFLGRVTQRVTLWGQALSTWMYRMMLFMSYNSEQMPFPFSYFNPDGD
jgi:hypothetical protein